MGKWQYIDAFTGRIRNEIEPVVDNLPFTNTLIHHDGTIFAVLDERGRRTLVMYSSSSAIRTLRRLDPKLFFVTMQGRQIYFAFDNFRDHLLVYSKDKDTMETLKLNTDIDIERQFVFVTNDKIVLSSHDQGRKTFTIEGKPWDRTGEPKLKVT